ncbi:MAG TPA: glycosyltransferase family 4 protein [Solirubrobacteraceae bacterium]|jgi:glycosyltransferase involved in cell wall biosynthesis|nr:glycosyltransferase family 4 protein [Solirubrobacteraceae bacterium]
MTAVTDVRVSDERPRQACRERWRAAMSHQQTEVLPRGAVAVSCSASPGNGGLGRHLQEILAALEGGGRQSFCILGASGAPARAAGQRARRPAVQLSRMTGSVSRLPLSQGLRALAHAASFDRDAAARLPSAEHLVAFNGQALEQLRAARRAGYRSVALVSANSHMRRVVRQHERARQRYPLEGSWTRWLLRRNLNEYREADLIYVASRYIRESFLEEGFSDALMADFPLTPHPRFDFAGTRASSGEFEIVYSGSLAVHKGVPLLIDAFRRLPHADMRLKLVGGWGTRGMRRFVEGAVAADPRITAGPGDPLDHLRTASLCVHPAYEDGFAYAPAEALAGGVPVIVSEDTGMKDLIDSSAAGLVLPTGDMHQLVEAIEAAYRGELFA